MLCKAAQLLCFVALGSLLVCPTYGAVRKASASLVYADEEFDPAGDILIATQADNNCREEFHTQAGPFENEIMTVQGDMGENCEVWVFEKHDGQHCDGDPVFYRKTWIFGDHTESPTGWYSHDFDQGVWPQCVRVCCGDVFWGPTTNNIPNVQPKPEPPTQVAVHVGDDAPSCRDCFRAISGLMAGQHSNDQCNSGIPLFGYGFSENSHAGSCKISTGPPPNASPTESGSASCEDVYSAAMTVAPDMCYKSKDKYRMVGEFALAHATIRIEKN